jgi:hypothetical protein
VISGLPFVFLLQSEGEKEKAEVPSAAEMRRIWQYADALNLDANPGEFTPSDLIVFC